MKKFGFLAWMLALLFLAVPTLAQTANDPVVIKIGDTVVPLSVVQAEFDARFEESSRFLTEYGMTMNEELLLMLREDVMNQLVQKIVMDRKVAEYGLDVVTDADKAELLAEVETMLATSVAAFAEQMDISTEEAMEEYERYGITVLSQYEVMLGNLPYSRLYEKVIEEIDITDERIESEYGAMVEYDKNLYGADVGSYELYTSIYGADTYYKPDGYRQVQRIVLEIPDGIGAELADYDAEMIALQDDIDALGQELFAAEEPDSVPDGAQTDRPAEEISAEIDSKWDALETLKGAYGALSEKVLPELAPVFEEIKARLAAGEAFGALIAEFSSDPLLDANPDGYFVHEESIVHDEPFRAGAMALRAIGDISDPILGEYGVYIILYAGDVDGGARPMDDEIKATIRQNLLAASQEMAYTQAIDSWLNDSAGVEVHSELIVLPPIDDLPPEDGEETVG
ncbi:MAG: SurA N-terminal domain-containing protein [Clostridia bacterium]|nr:SurA N-terminal domain-containing protein [Clostridia bacterium]